MADICGESSSRFSLANDNHHQNGNYEEGCFDDELNSFVNVKHHRGENHIMYDDQKEAASVSEQEENNRKTKNRQYTFIIRSKAQIYTCEFCQKILKYRSKYLEHLRTHTGERPFGCTYCGASFTQRGALKQHERIHTGDRPHYCLQCQKSFRTASALNVHLKSHPDTVISGRGTTARDLYLDDHARIEEELAYEAQQEIEYIQLLEQEESHEFTHRWQVSHITQPIVDATHIAPESELSLAMFPDGRLQVNDTILEGEHFPMEEITLYYYTLTNDEVLTFLYDNANDTLEIVETNETASTPEEAIPEEVGVQHYDGHFEAPEDAYEVYEEVLPESGEQEATSSKYVEVYETDDGQKDIKTELADGYINEPPQVAHNEQLIDFFYY
jgi:hypothetical protein